MYGDTTAEETQLVHQLHDLAVSIAAAKSVNDVAAVKGLWEQFRTVAERYNEIGSGERGVLDFVNRVQDGVLEFLNAAGEVGVKTLKVVSGTVLIPLALIAGALYFGPSLLRRKRSA